MRQTCRAAIFTLLLVVWPGWLLAQRSSFTTALPPFRIADNLFYVGSRDLAAYLVVTPAGDILINANLPSSPPQILRSLQQLGVRPHDVKILLISHAHPDHAGGAAELLAATGAQSEGMEGDVSVVESGGRTDFAYGAQPDSRYPPARVNRVLHDGDAVTLGGVTLTAHRTAGHTEGCTTWTMAVHLMGEPAGERRQVVIVGSWNVNPGYRLVAAHGRPPSYPGVAEDFKATFATLQALPCDIFLASHGTFFDLLGKVARLPQEGARVWLDPAGYQRALAEGRLKFEQTLRRQEMAASGPVQKR